MSNSPIRSREELATATARRIRYQVRWELQQLVAEQTVTQEGLMDRLGYVSNTQASKWVNGKAPLPEKAARKLDELFDPTTLGVSWIDLVKAQRAASRRDGGRDAAPGDIYDVFLASPMSAAVASGTYTEERKDARAVRDTLEHWLRKRVYYAGADLEDEDQFDVPDIAAEVNFDALRESKYFMLLMSGRPTSPIPSSVWVEAGYAMALKIPMLLLVPDGEMLPYILRSLMQSRAANLLPTVLMYPVSGVERADVLLRNRGEEIFARLDELTMGA